MGLYIAGLRMPKPGTYTKFTVYGDGRVVLHFGGKYVGDAVEVKKPHGRLIDADAMIRELEKWSSYPVPYIQKRNLEFIHFLKEAETVVEAEGEKLS
jgi:hypothetical protein